MSDEPSTKGKLTMMMMMVMVMMMMMMMRLNRVTLYNVRNITT